MKRKFKEYLNEEAPYESLTDTEILRESIKEEYYASNLYRKLARRAQSQDVKRILEHVAKEEIAHVGEFEALLKKLDHEHEEYEDKGEEEVKDMGINIPD